MEKKTGYIKIFRSIKEHWLWESDAKKTKLEAWLDLLFMASHQDSPKPFGYDLITIKRGQILTSQEKLSKSWGWSRAQVRSYLSMLENDQMINQQTTNKFTLITICNYASYQDKTPAKQPAKQPANNQQTDTYKELKELKEKIEERTLNFKNSLAPFIPAFGKPLIIKFFNYWSELSKDGKKIRFEKEEYWSLENRLEKWQSDERLLFQIPTSPNGITSATDELKKLQNGSKH